MIMEVLKGFSFLIFLNMKGIAAQDTDPQTTVETIIIETTTEDVTIITDIPQSDVELAMNIDYGRYTTMVFNYINHQFARPHWSERCFNDYTKCIISLEVPTPLCVVNNPYLIPDGYATFNSYCDVYFDNCLRQMRFWRILNYGKCNLEGGRYYNFNIYPSRK